MNRLAIFGSGGFAKELLDLAIDQGYHEICFLEKQLPAQGSRLALLGFPVLSEQAIPQLTDWHFAIGVADPALREKIFQSYPQLHYPTLIHSQASLGYGIRSALEKRQGNVVAAGARITNSCQFGDFILVSFNSTVGHDCVLEDYVSIMPGANVSGCVQLKQGTYIGTNAAILPGKNTQQLKCLEPYSVIAAGAVVVKDTQPHKTYIGIPAKEKTCDERY